RPSSAGARKIWNRGEDRAMRFTRTIWSPARDGTVKLRIFVVSEPSALTLTPSLSAVATSSASSAGEILASFPRMRSGSCSAASEMVGALAGRDGADGGEGLAVATTGSAGLPSLPRATDWVTPGSRLTQVTAPLG